MLHDRIIYDNRSGFDIHGHLVQGCFHLMLLAAFQQIVAPEIIPITLGQIDCFALLSLNNDRRNQYLRTKTEFLLPMQITGNFLLQHYQRTQDGQAIAVMFPENRVDIWEKPVTKLNKFAVDSLEIFPETPRLPLSSITGRMSPHKR